MILHQDKAALVMSRTLIHLQKLYKHCHKAIDLFLREWKTFLLYKICKKFSLKYPVTVKSSISHVLGAGRDQI